VILFLSLFALLLGTAIHLPAILFIALIAVALISTALAIYSLITIGKDKEHLKGIGNSVTAFILNIITILICLIALSIIFN
jgi:phosphoglycerol transferase MdoB-like AlkP superfamily enzyme